MCLTFEAFVCSRGNPTKLHPMTNVPESTCERGTKQTLQSNPPAWTINMWKFFPHLASIPFQPLKFILETLHPTVLAEGDLQCWATYLRWEPSNRTQINLIIDLRGKKCQFTSTFLHIARLARSTTTWC